MIMCSTEHFSCLELNRCSKRVNLRSQKTRFQNQARNILARKSGLSTKREKTKYNGKKLKKIQTSSSPMVVGSAVSARTITLLAEQNAIDVTRPKHAMTLMASPDTFSDVVVPKVKRTWSKLSKSSLSQRPSPSLNQKPSPSLRKRPESPCLRS